jgi:hypothetical protein
MQIEMFSLGARSGSEKVTPISEGDILQTAPFGRVVVTHASADAHDRGVYVCLRLDNGAQCVVLDREVQYRSR